MLKWMKKNAKNAKRNNLFIIMKFSLEANHAQIQNNANRGHLKSYWYSRL